MVCRCWLWVVVVVACGSVPGLGSSCSDSPACSDLSSRQSIEECVRSCTSGNPTDIPEVSEPPTKTADNSGDDDNSNNEDELLLSILMNILASEEQMPDSDLRAHIDRQRSFTTENFRWGKPSGRMGSKGDRRRSYSMEHFRWGKPPGRKRRPVKISAPNLDGGESTEGSFLSQFRRHLSSKDEGSKEIKNQASNRGKSQRRKDGTYRMNHFRWGSPHVSKRNRNFMRAWEERPRGPLTNLFRNILIKEGIRE
ncbi:pro-opiomelanocortin-like [Synchiropus splendidus]|uniref:pro-opiomelanocortin-like n=1 Tax=Synchiropus splendidus TaxID=270530 RepID=UPI00237DD96D|nr:pro-opiomelanocortin-like [Synchiropus splendidus]